MYKKIKCKEIEATFELQDLIVMASYPGNDNQAENFAIKLSRLKKPVAVFNLRKSAKEDNDVIKEDYLYMDYRENIDIDYIEKQCYQLEEIMPCSIIIISYERKIKCVEDNLGFRLKKLCQDLNKTIFVLCDLKESATINEYPTLEDMKNKDVIEFADVIWLTNDEKGICILAKNAHGDVGILVSDDEVETEEIIKTK